MTSGAQWGRQKKQHKHCGTSSCNMWTLKQIMGNNWKYKVKWYTQMFFSALWNTVLRRNIERRPSPHKVMDEIEAFESPILKRFESLYLSSETNTNEREYEVMGDKIPDSSDSWRMEFLGWKLPVALPTKWVWSWGRVKPVLPSKPVREPPKKYMNAEYNVGMDLIMYNRVGLKEMLANESNELERTWKSKRLLVHTPRGNVIMYYDVFKEGFAYHSDCAAIPYRILNAVAMKYVMVFRCLNLFIDENVVYPNPSPLIELSNLEEQNEQQKKWDVTHSMLQGSSSNNPFVRSITKTLSEIPKNGSGVGGGARPPKEGRVEAPIRRQNRFLYMGNMRNVVLLKSTPPLTIPLKQDSSNTTYDYLFEKKPMSYKSFKMFSVQP